MFNRRTPVEKAADKAEKARQKAQQMRENDRRMVAQIWRKKGKAGFIYILSAEAAPVTPAHVKYLRPARTNRPDL